MSDNEHVRAIREAINAGLEPTGDWEYISVENQEAVLHHATALAADLAEATARAESAERLRKAALNVRYEASNAKYGRISTDTWQRFLDAIDACTDLDAAPGDTAGERAT